MLPECAASILPVSTLTIMAAPVLRQRVSATLQEARRLSMHSNCTDAMQVAATALLVIQRKQTQY